VLTVKGTYRPTWTITDVPVGFPWTPPFDIYRSGATFAPVSTFDITDLMPAATKTYYVTKTGSDAADGLTWETALRNVYTAVRKADVDRVYIGAGVYDRVDGWQGQDLIRSCAVIGVGDVTITCHQPSLSWALTAGQTYTYQVTRASAQWAFDAGVLNTNGEYTRYSLQSSIATVEANAGSFWISGTTVYIHTIDNRAPDANVLVMLSVPTGDAIGNITVYLENLKFYGGSYPFRHQSNGVG